MDELSGESEEEELMDEGIDELELGNGGTGTRMRSFLVLS